MAEVLQKLADDTDSTLEMEQEPPGKFSRHDWRRHTRREAVRILNLDLEKTGFRIVEKDQFLKVVKLQKLHVDYDRPVLGERRAPVVVKEIIGEEPTESEGDGIRVVSHEPQPRPKAKQPPQPLTPASSVQPIKNRRDTRVQQVQLESSDEQPQAEVAPPESQQSSITYKPARRKANDIARQIHAAFGERSTIANAGPHDLPAFIVASSREAGSAPNFTIEIDSDRNELIVTSSEQTITQVETLMRMLDKTQTQRGQKQELVAGNSAAVAEKLQRSCLS